MGRDSIGHSGNPVPDGFCSPEEAEVRTVIAVSVRLASEVMSFGYGPYRSDEVADLVMARLLA